MEIEAFVLIGGKSSRMAPLGCDKALLKLGGVTLAQRAVDMIRQAFPSAKISLVARDKGQFAAEDLPENIPVVHDIYKDRGAYSGLHAALIAAGAAKSEWIFVLACDLPFVTVDLPKFMASLINGVFEAIVNVTPEGYVQPLCGFYRVEPCLNAIEEEIKSSEKLPPVKAVLEKMETRFVEISEIAGLQGTEDLFFNVNSPEDLRRAQAALPDLRRNRAES